MITQEEFKMEEGIKNWNMLFTVLFALLIAVFLVTFEKRDWYFFQNIGISEITILSLAIARIIRLLCYDNITLFLREAFLDVKTVKQVEGGIEQYERIPSENTLKRTAAKLLHCPWCIGVWVSLFSFWLYRDFPVLYFVFLVLALSQLASMIQMFASTLGWSAEYKKIRTQKLQ